MGPLTKLGLEEVGSTANTQLAAEAAAQSMTLLERGQLPFEPTSAMKLAVLGPLANATTPLLGTHYKGAACPGLHGQKGKEDDAACVRTIYQELQAQAPASNAQYGAGCQPVQCGSTAGHGDGASYKCKLAPCTDATIAAAVALAKRSTHVVLVLGITGLESEGTGGDRHSIDLPADQRALTGAILALRKPTTIVMVNGGGVSLEQEKDAGAAILEAYLPGAHGAKAVADVILGHRSPAGRLIYTVYKAGWVNETSMTEMDPTVGV